MAPPTTARSISPDHSARQATCTAVSDVAQAASTPMLGPRRSSQVETRPGKMPLTAAPSAACMSYMSALRRTSQ
ncbi:hypothetical protein MF672_043660 [Actinomadura sp. ATCC 31491]|uniref:Uncharacterized protein n=1 Tax=Actinomadura luzonensis TaxID=2805427 RepID=A0ABT0G7T7_9ACTN|nr:hypothetical protein [Actinomadura luzonensis]MCK2220655.1 hypothetical protein [Actinomadura luzonensis]